MDLDFEIDSSLFQERKRRRISTMNTVASVPKPAPTSAPGVHEIATFLPGRLEFEHEIDNEAEDLVKDLEFGVCLEHGGDQMVLDENDNDVLARIKLEEEKRKGKDGGLSTNGIDVSFVLVNGNYVADGPPNVKKEAHTKGDSQDNPADVDANAEEPTLPPPFETQDSLNFKLTLLEMYRQRIEKRVEGKAIIFDRGLLEYKKVHSNSKSHLRSTTKSISFLDAGSGEEEAERRKGNRPPAEAACQIANR